MSEAPRSRPRRYQLRRPAAEAVAHGHPWVFRGAMSSAADGFADGQWLRLHDGGNAIVGHGVYAARGAIAIRVARRGAAPVDGAHVRATVEAALARRAALAGETDAIRELHGESDGLPAVTLDRYGDVGVLTTYAAGVEGLARLAAAHVARARALRHLIWRTGHRAIGDGDPIDRILRGAPPAHASVREGDLALAVALRGGQKSGAFLDLRGLRRWLRGRPLAGARVLDLFSYAGGLGLATAAAGAAEVVHADASHAALAFGAAHHALGPARHRWIEADLFRGLPPELLGQAFDVVIADPPQMTSRMEQVPRALAAYRRLYAGLAAAVAPGGTLIACCCTGRIAPAEARRAIERGLGPEFCFVERLATEPDHPVGFPEADYLKVLIYRRA